MTFQFHFVPTKDGGMVHINEEEVGGPGFSRD